jgi:hypothetical protein
MKVASLVGVALVNAGAFGAPVLALVGVVLLAPLMVVAFRGLAA